MHISIQQVVKQYQGKVVLQDVSLDVAKGQFVALLGPSGCGKTTLLNALAGLTSIDSGTITVDGRVLSTKGHTVIPEQRRIGMVFQDFALWPHMSVYENVAFGLKIRKEARNVVQERVAEVLKAVRMEGYEDRFPHQLSGGQKQRIAIARAIAPAPTVLLLDEPLSSLDAKLREDMRWELLSIIQQMQITAIYVTHDQTEALSMADHIALLREGRVEQQGTPPDLYHHPKTRFTASFLGASNAFEGTVTHQTENTVTLDCGGFEIKAIHRGNVTDASTVVTRPTSIVLIPEGETQHVSPDVDGTFAWAVIRQRAFHGLVWQYRLEIIDSRGLRVEVWHSAQLPVDSTVKLFFPLSSCLSVCR